MPQSYYFLEAKYHVFSAVSVRQCLVFFFSCNRCRKQLLQADLTTTETCDLSLFMFWLPFRGDEKKIHECSYQGINVSTSKKKRFRPQNARNIKAVSAKDFILFFGTRSRKNCGLCQCRCLLLTHIWDQLCLPCAALQQQKFSIFSLTPFYVILADFHLCS